MSDREVHSGNSGPPQTNPGKMDGKWIFIPESAIPTALMQSLSVSGTQFTKPAPTNSVPNNQLNSSDQLLHPPLDYIGNKETHRTIVVADVSPDERPLSRAEKIWLISAVVGIGVVAIIAIAALASDWVKGGIATCSLSGIKIGATQVDYNEAIKNCDDSAGTTNTSCIGLKVFFATCVVMVVLGSVAIVLDAAEGVLMALLLFRRCSRRRFQILALSKAVAILCTIGIIAIIGGFIVFKYEYASDAEFAAGGGLGFTVVVLAIGKAVFVSWLLRRKLARLLQKMQVGATTLPTERNGDQHLIQGQQGKIQT